MLASKTRAARVAVPGGALYAEEHGEGPPLLLIQGLGQGLWAWRYQVPVLARRRRVITFDTRGTGRSSKPPGPYTIAQLAEDALIVLETFDASPAHVAGFSMGGYVALTLVLAHPDAVRSLVLAGTGAGGPNRVPRPLEVRAAFEEAFGLPPEEFGRRTMPYTFSPGWPERSPERFEEILAARLEHPTPAETLLAHADACYGYYDTGCEVERIAVPTLVVHGDADLIVPVENGRMLAARLPGAEYVELDGRGHNLMLEDPDSFNELVEEFLTRAEPS
ncbi:MAG: alpha/beta hydrolase [Actinomycetota bacterium]|nr:alpha/beta hydrolase [Actinomycetota bacterium]